MFLGFWLDMVLSNFISHMSHLYSEQFVTQPHVFLNADESILLEFCPVAKDDLLAIAKIENYFYLLIMIAGIGYATAIVQKFTVIRLNDNAEL